MARSGHAAGDGVMESGGVYRHNGAAVDERLDVHAKAGRVAVEDDIKLAGAVRHNGLAARIVHVHTAGAHMDDMAVSAKPHHTHAHMHRSIDALACAPRMAGAEEAGRRPHRTLDGPLMTGPGAASRLFRRSTFLNTDRSACGAPPFSSASVAGCSIGRNVRPPHADHPAAVAGPLPRPFARALG